MLEIVLLIVLCCRMGSILRAKNRNPLFMQVMVVAVWIVSVFIGAIAYSVYVAVIRGSEGVENMGLLRPYLSALVAALIGQITDDTVIATEEDVDQMIGQSDCKDDPADQHRRLRNPQRGFVLTLTDVVELPAPIDKTIGIPAKAPQKTTNSPAPGI